mmetsp:Transcript_18452/g.27013  ORF Transcript_18452/g.27013 Transcript_18452/m.27013 type:complete len:288 (-) Transcript_18452:51-914(-)
MGRGTRRRTIGRVCAWLASVFGFIGIVMFPVGLSRWAAANDALEFIDQHVQYGQCVINDTVAVTASYNSGHWDYCDCDEYKCLYGIGYLLRPINATAAEGTLYAAMGVAFSRETLTDSEYERSGCPAADDHIDAATLDAVGGTVECWLVNQQWAPSEIGRCHEYLFGDEDGDDWTMRLEEETLLLYSSQPCGMLTDPTPDALESQQQQFNVFMTGAAFLVVGCGCAIAAVRLLGDRRASHSGEEPPVREMKGADAEALAAVLRKLQAETAAAATSQVLKRNPSVSEQ